jgi:DNA polymerase III alpha subunit
LKALGLRQLEVVRFCDRIPDDDLEEGLVPLPLQLLPNQYRAAVPLIERLIGKLQHISVHPGGVVIAEPRIDSYTPVERAPKGVLVTQYDMLSLEKMGLIKIDLLGNRALSAVQETLDWASQPAAEAPNQDPRTLLTLQEGRTIGCFQIETPTMRALLKKLRLRGIEDLIAALAIVRPGPASGAAKAAYIRRANGEEQPEPPHPRLTDRLQETYGILLYEEDVMAAISLMTGWSLEMADLVRSALLQSQDDRLEMASLETDFLKASALTGVPASEALTVWRTLVRFAAYSFNKAHASSYAQLAWQSAFLKAHYPVEFACAVLNHYGGLYPLRAVAADFARHGVPILAPHVNVSGIASSVQVSSVRIGLGAIKRITHKTLERIVTARPFQFLRDFLDRVPVTFRELEALVLCGACDDLAPLTTEAYPFAHDGLLATLKDEQSGGAPGEFVTQGITDERVERYRLLVRIHNELKFLEMHLAAHPLRLLRKEATRLGCVSTAELAEREGESIKIAGIVSAARRVATSRGRIMQFVTLEDEFGLVEAVLFPEVYAALEDPVTNPGPFLVSGRVKQDRGDVHLLVSAVMPFHEREQPYSEPAAST